MAKFLLYRIPSILIVILLCWLVGHAVDSIVPGSSVYTWKRIIYLCSFYGILAVSLNLINGITGQFSIGHAGFYQVGAYAGAYMSKFIFHFDGPLLLLAVTLFGAAFAGLTGWVIGMPSLRLKGDYLAVATLGFGEIIRILVINQDPPNVGFLNIGGSFGFRAIPHLTTLFYSLLLLAFTVAICRNLLKTPHGLAFLAIREDEMAADAMGVNTTRYKVWAFVIGAALAGAAGALFAHYEGFINPDTFKMDVSFIVLTMIVIGGAGSITGSLVAGFGLIVLQEKLKDMGQIQAGSVYMVALLMFVAAPLIAKFCRERKPKRAVAFTVWTSGMAVAAVLGRVLGLKLANVPALSESMGKFYQAADLRMVLFAIALIVVMLVRPQGIFAHHEFSWTFVGKLLGRKSEAAQT